MRRCVRSRNLMNEEVLAHWGAVAPETNKQVANMVSFSFLYTKRLVAFAVEACTDEGKVVFVPAHDVMKVLWEHEH